MGIFEKDFSKNPRPAGPDPRKVARVDLSFLFVCRLDGTDRDGFMPSSLGQAKQEADLIAAGLRARAQLSARVRAWRSTGSPIELEVAAALGREDFSHLGVTCRACDLYGEWRVRVRSFGGYPEGPLLGCLRTVGLPELRARTGGLFLCPHWDRLFEADPEEVRAVYELELVAGG